MTKKLKSFEDMLGESQVFRYEDWINEDCDCHNADQIQGGLADGKTPEEIADKHGVDVKDILDQIEKGTTVEFEHTDNKELACEIAKDHLWEDPKYYDKLASIENGEEEQDEVIPDTTETPGMLSDNEVAEAIKWDGKNLQLGGKSYASIPGPNDEDVIVFSNKEGEVRIYRNKEGLYGDFGSYDKTFKNEEELVKHLNDNKFTYVGIDDRY